MFGLVSDTVWQTFQGSHSMTDLPALSGSLEAEGFGHDIFMHRDWTGDGQIDLVISVPLPTSMVYCSRTSSTIYQQQWYLYKLASISGSENMNGWGIG